MNKTEYEQLKQEIEAKYGKGQKDFDGSALNEAQRQLNSLKGKYLADLRAVKKQKSQPNQYTPESTTPLNDVLSPDIKSKYRNVALPDITLLDKDLEAFDAIEKDILRAYFSNRSLTSKTLANQFSKSYQFVAGLLKRPAVDRLKLKYFYEVLSDETQLALMRGVKAGDSKLIEASAEYLKVLGQGKTEADEYSSTKLDVDDHTKYVLKLVADWLASDTNTDLILKKPSMPESVQ